MSILYFILAALGLGILVFIHELGHYFVAKWTGMTVEVFSIGFGKPILKWRVGDVDWQLGWLPFGGYVKIKGMEFSKKDREIYQEPYEIPDGFFSKSPWKRIAVGAAGPMANFLLALLIFTAIWAFGGREKPFSEYTQLVGWVDPQSEIYANGVRPGDELTSYNGKPFKGSKDLLYAAMLGGDKVNLTGYHIDYATKERAPFNYTVNTYPAPGSLDEIKTTGITAGARYLIYDNYPDGSLNELAEGSPMIGSGIKPKDNIVWADGELLFSLTQLSHIINNNRAYLTVQRGDTIFSTRQPRVSALDLRLPAHVRNELIDWQYEVGLKKQWEELTVLPYVISTEGYVETPLSFIDEESKLQAFRPPHYRSELEEPLQAGDRILSIYGKPVTSGYILLKELQTPQSQLIVQRNVPVDTKVSWKIEDQVYTGAIDYHQIQQIAQSIGSEQPVTQAGSYQLLNSVTPKPITQFNLPTASRQQMQAEYDKQREEIASMRNSDRRQQAYAYLDRLQSRNVLGILLQDRQVRYNPGPFVMFSDVFVETGRTLKALVTGNLNPKWLSGPVGIVRVIHHGWTVGIFEALFWISAISINLGVLNLLPIPVLDGGYICLCIWELVTRKRVKSKTMERLIVPFVILLFGFLIYLTFQDITRLF